ncbi:SRPBCC family protein [Nocardioides sp. zg-536]|uniref:SRPBCC family protein n=1 Tax=Nocardioides faecalis TaxID=2803858 RepID=A0A938Y079_9ACTN|nr:SRPBCC family protein [Nocardioides faecalis]MBM9459481.1 SRPBCC family protein [Nocardioides faecalis]MBS4751722.1 SRPBCC family protein [Nocardioides faecalis]QVI59418.1 SRPBCC family protein [Nocardioides faecalis]
MVNVVEHTVEVDAPVSAVFDYVDDFSASKDWVYGLKRIEPVTEQRDGVGAEYDGVMRIGVTLKARIRCTERVPDELLQLTSIGGITNVQTWRFTPIDAGRTRVHAELRYTLPGGPAGRVIARAVQPMVGVAVRSTAEALVRNVEERIR